MKPFFKSPFYSISSVLAVLFIICLIKLLYSQAIELLEIIKTLFKDKDWWLGFLCPDILCNRAVPYVVYNVESFLAIFLFAYFVVFCITKIFNLPQSLPPVKLQKRDLPRLLPLPIPTFNETNYFKRLIIAITQVRKFELTEHWFYKFKGDGSIIVIPQGFEFDGASVPKPFWIFLSPIGLLLLPGLVHDFAYGNGFLWVIDLNGTPVRRRLIVSGSKYKWMPYDQSQLIRFEKKGKKDWDILFKDLCDEINKPLFIFFVARAALWLGGWVAWNGHAKNRRQAFRAQPGFPSGAPPSFSSADLARIARVREK